MARKIATTLALAGLIGLVCYNQARARAATAKALPGEFVDVDGVRLHFVSRGNGLPLILLHGNGSAAEDFDSAGIVDAAARGGYRVIAFDRPGFGRSSRGNRLFWTPVAQADLIQAALRRIGVERYVVLGHSFGALVALQLALRHRLHVAGLVLVSGYYFPRPRLDLFLASLPAAPLLGAVFRASLLPPLARMTWPLLMRQIFGPSRVPAGFSGRMRELATRPAQLKSTAVESALLLAEAGLHRPYREITARTGIMAGASDRLIDAPEQARRLHGLIADSTVEIVEAGHMAHHAWPDAVLEMIDRVAGAAEHARVGAAA